MERFVVSYRIFASSEKDALQRAEAVALEQTVEIPRDVVPAGYIEDVIVGKVETIEPEGGQCFIAKISFSPDSCGDEMAQLINVIFGNSSIQKGIKVTGFEPGATIASRFSGARFGIKGIRELCGRNEGGLIAPVIKPQGSSAEELAGIAYRCALAGADVIKDDHGLTDQPMAPFRERCEKISAAVDRANRQTGGSTLYFPNLAGHQHDLEGFARFAKDAGAAGVLVMPGLFGFGLIHRLASDPSFGLPIMAHPSFLGPFVLSADTGFTHAMILGTLQRLAGTDISIFPNVGGRFGFSTGECTSVAKACRSAQGPGRPIFPSPGGGMSVERAAGMAAMYGPDVVYLLGGSLLRYGDKIGDGIKDMRTALTKAETGLSTTPPSHC